MASLVSAVTEISGLLERSSSNTDSLLASHFIRRADIVGMSLDERTHKMWLLEVLHILERVDGGPLSAYCSHHSNLLKKARFAVTSAREPLERLYEVGKGTL